MPTASLTTITEVGLNRPPLAKFSDRDAVVTREHQVFNEYYLIHNQKTIVI